MVASFKLEVTFMLWFLPVGKCQAWALREPNNGQKSCSALTHGGQFIGHRCEMTCNAGYVFYGEDSPLLYQCANDTDWDRGIFVPDCVSE